MPEIAKYVQVNSFGTAQMLEVIREEKPADQKGRRRVLTGGLQRRRRPVSRARPRFSRGAPDGTTRSRRLVGALPDLRRSHDERADAGERAGRRRNRLWPNESRSGKIGPAMGQTNRDTHGRAPLFLHLRAAPIDLQSLHRCDRDFLHASAQRSAAGALRRRRTDPRFFIR